MDKSRKKIAQDYARNAIADGNTSAGRYEKKMAVKEAAGEGPKMYGEDHGAKMTADPSSYRSSMSRHWHQSNLLKENPIVNHATGK